MAKKAASTGTAKRAARRVTTAQRQRTTYVAMILDRSGSMEQIKQATIDGFNKQLDSIRANASEGGRTVVSLTTFASDVLMPVWGGTADQVQHLNHFNYNPNGGTAMNDAIGQTVSRLLDQPVDSPDTSYLVVVVTDGQENASKFWGSIALAKLIASLQATKRWTFSVAGANIDLRELSTKLSIPMANTYTYMPNAASAGVMWESTACSTGDYLRGRSRGLTASANFYSGPDDLTLDQYQKP